MKSAHPESLAQDVISHQADVDIFLVKEGLLVHQDVRGDVLTDLVVSEDHLVRLHTA
jgi:hypothetical protein